MTTPTLRAGLAWLVFVLAVAHVFASATTAARARQQAARASAWRLLGHPRRGLDTWAALLAAAAPPVVFGDVGVLFLSYATAFVQHQAPPMLREGLWVAGSRCWRRGPMRWSS